jgi:tRNA A-37 threonylcarbamoyl transferase component Bud32
MPCNPHGYWSTRHAKNIVVVNPFTITLHQYIILCSKNVTYISMQIANILSLSFQKSEPLTQAALNELLVNADTVFEQDQYGIKVAKLANGDFIKIFRIKNLISVARIYSYAKMFCRNAGRIAELGIPTVKVKQLYHIENSNKSAVIYAPLVGETILEILHSKRINTILCRDLGVFMANLHEKGIYFRGLHLGNIVLTPDNKLGLIDVADMTIFPWPLDCRRRLKNFSRFWRDFENKFMFGYESIQALIEGYHSNCKKVSVKLADIQKRMM